MKWCIAHRYCGSLDGLWWLKLAKAIQLPGRQLRHLLDRVIAALLEHRRTRFDEDDMISCKK